MSNYAKIIPYKKLPRNRHYFDYAIPNELEGKLDIGQIVKIPFKNSEILGLVSGFSPKTEFEYIKEIIKTTEYDFSTKQMDFLNWFSDYYVYSKGSIFRLMFSDLPIKKTDWQDQFKLEPEIKSDSKTQEKTAEQIYCSREKNIVILPNRFEEKLYLYKALCQKILAKNEQILILFPQKSKLQRFTKMLNKNVRQKTVLVTNELSRSKNQYFKVWQKIKMKEVNIVLGTRSTVFMPFENYKVVVIDDCHSDDHKSWDQNPRYNVIDIIQKWQELIKCQVIYSSQTPRIEDVFRLSDKKIIELGNLSNIKSDVLDITQERKNEFVYVCKPIIETIKKTINKDQNVLVVVNKKGKYSALYCQDCGTETVCPECKLPMVVTEDQKLVCFRCKQEMELYLNCPKCNSLKLKQTGFGLEKIKEVIQDEVESIDNIYFTTGQSISEINLPEISVVVFAYIDSLMYLADYNSNFRLYSYIQEILQTINQGQNCLVLTQTSFVGNPIFENLLNYKKFYSDELSTRKELNYPPFRETIKLIIEHHDQKISQREANSVYNKIVQFCSESIYITEPYEFYAQKVRNRFRFQISLLFLKKDLNKIREILDILPDYWIVDRNPLNLL